MRYGWLITWDYQSCSWNQCDHAVPYERLPYFLKAWSEDLIGFGSLISLFWACFYVIFPNLIPNITWLSFISLSLPWLYHYQCYGSSSSCFSLTPVCLFFWPNGLFVQAVWLCCGCWFRRSLMVKKVLWSSLGALVWLLFYCCLLLWVLYCCFSRGFGLVPVTSLELLSFFLNLC
jgi:hypothetical protein